MPEHPPETPDEAVDEAWARHILAELEDPAGPFLGPEVRARSARSPGPGWIAAALLLGLGGVAALSVHPPEDTLLPRGGTIDPAVELTFLLESDDVRRTGDPRIPPGTAVIFRVRTRDGGFLCLEEQAGPEQWTRILPAPGEAWSAVPGAHLAQRDGAVQAFRTDHPPGPRAYRAMVAGDAACERDPVVSTVLLEWLE